MFFSELARRRAEKVRKISYVAIPGGLAPRGDKSA